MHFIRNSNLLPVLYFFWNLTFEPKTQNPDGECPIWVLVIMSYYLLEFAPIPVAPIKFIPVPSIRDCNWITSYLQTNARDIA